MVSKEVSSTFGINGGMHPNIWLMELLCLGNINSLHAEQFLVVCFFFKINIFEKFFQEYIQIVKTVWIQIRPDFLSGLIWVQIVCKDSKQTTLVGKRLSVNFWYKLLRRILFPASLASYWRYIVTDLILITLDA